MLNSLACRKQSHIAVGSVGEDMKNFCFYLVSVHVKIRLNYMRLQVIFALRFAKCFSQYLRYKCRRGRSGGGRPEITLAVLMFYKN